MFAARLSASRKIILSFALVGALMLGVGLMMLLVINSSANNAKRVEVQLAPLTDAAMMAQMKFSGVYLRLGQVFAGDLAPEKAEGILGMLDDVRAFARAISEGARLGDTVVRPSDDPEVWEMMNGFLEQVASFEKAAKARLAAMRSATGVGSRADAEFDGLYDEIEEGLGRIAGQLPADSPAQRLLGEARYRLAHGHLLLAEILSGDQGEDFAEVTGSFEAARSALAEATGTAPAMTEALKPVVADIGRLIALAQGRHEEQRDQASRIASAEKAYSAAHARAVETAERAERKIRAQMRSGLRDIEESRKSAVIVFGLSVALLALAVFFISRWLGRVLGRRLSELAGVMRRMIGGQYDVAPPAWRSDDEIGVLRDSLAEFGEALRAQHELTVEAERKRRAEQKRMEASEELARQLDNALQAVAAGDLSVRIDESFEEEDLRGLARGVNGLMDTIGSVLSSIEQVMSQLADGDLTARIETSFRGSFEALRTRTNLAVEQLEAGAAEVLSRTADADEQTARLTEMSRQLAGQAESQAAALQQISAATEEMSDRVRRTAERSLAAVKQADEADRRAVEGLEIVAQSGTAMEAMKESSARIADIITIIESIAFQTNLLALNAAVEAARAGDAGKGFAVVASEVRSLAQRSSEAASDITQLIRDSATRVETGADLAHATNETLTAIQSVVTDLTKMIREISTDNDHVSSSIGELTSAIRDLDGTTQSYAAAAERGSSSAASVRQVFESIRRAMDRFRTRGGEGVARAA
ncbi:MAG: methyl-accepting chemotaxis protein [Alphaproteobacteria bacterium]|nr:MAG: methyl-accepting chemotaxis protein [Alphaproteobacteria bacterium]